VFNDHCRSSLGLHFTTTTVLSILVPLGLFFVIRPTIMGWPTQFF